MIRSGFWKAAHGESVLMRRNDWLTPRREFVNPAHNLLIKIIELNKIMKDIMLESGNGNE